MGNSFVLLAACASKVSRKELFMPLHGIRGGGLGSGEIVVTDDEIGVEVDAYLAIARRLLNEVIEYTLAHAEARMITPEQRTEDRRTTEKELNRWKKAVDELKLSARHLADDNKRLGEEVAELQEQNENLRRQLNEALMRSESQRIRHNLPKDEPGQYPLTQHMSERAFKAWQQMLTEIPYGGDKNEPA